MSASTRSHDRERERLIEKFMPFARAVAAKESDGLPIEISDAIQAAYLGLTEAAMRFDFNKCEPEAVETVFKVFSYLRIRGAVIDEVRRMSLVRRRGVEKGIRAFTVSLDETVERDGFEAPLIELEAVSEDSDLVIDFGFAFNALDHRQQRVISALMSGAKGKELADELGVTESRISQIAKEAKDVLLERMHAD